MEEVALGLGEFYDSKSEGIIEFGLFPEGKRKFEFSHKIKLFFWSMTIFLEEKNSSILYKWKKKARTQWTKEQKWKVFRGQKTIKKKKVWYEWEATKCVHEKAKCVHEKKIQ